MSLKLECAVRSDVGLVRSHNEDAVFASCRMAAVADGVGGHAAGEVASRLVIDQLVLMDKSHVQEAPAEDLAAAIDAGNQTISFATACRPELAGMSTTLTVVLIGDDYSLANIGDSRAYLLRGGVLTQLTRDDSFVQELIDAGELDPADARRHARRSVVLEVLDGRPARTATFLRVPARMGDRLLVCSDGLTDFVDTECIREALAHPLRDEAVDLLVASALSAGGRDNVSVIIADVVPGEALGLS